MNRTSTIHPRDALSETTPSLPVIPSCDHYAGSEKLLLKSLQRQQDLGVVFDITADNEDGASVGAEIENLKKLLAIIVAAQPSSRIGVRIHPLSSPWWRQELDLVCALAGNRITHLTIPKVDTAEALKECMTVVTTACARYGVKKPIPVHVLVESIVAVKNVWEIAAVAGLRGLDFGLMDYVSSFGGALPSSAMRSPEQFSNQQIIHAKREIVAAATAHGLIAAHNVSTQFTAPGVAYSDAVRAKQEYGFLRMWSIHPDQIPAIVAAFAPAPEYILKAGEILLTAQTAAWAPIRAEGILHDRASYRTLWTDLRRAHLAGMPIAPAVKTAFFAAEDP